MEQDRVPFTNYVMTLVSEGLMVALPTLKTRDDEYILRLCGVPKMKNSVLSVFNFKYFTAIHSLSSLMQF